MSKFAWCSDIHLDNLRKDDGSPDEAALIKFSENLIKDDPSGIIITGDISTSSQLVYHLSAVERVVQRPIYYVLGNHDFWGSSFDAVRTQMRDVARHTQYLRYLTDLSYVPITPATALVGHDGWYDARNGDWRNSTFVMYDWYKIHDFLSDMGPKPGPNGLPSNAMGAVVARCRTIADNAAKQVAAGIKGALRYHKSIIVATHMPPFEQSHIYGGKIGDPGAQPWYTSRVMGEMILEAARQNPGVRFTVLAGHTHGEFNGQIANNVYCHVAHADYGKPRIASLIEVA